MTNEPETLPDCSAFPRSLVAGLDRGHLPSLDGIRAIAAFMVVFYHLNVLWISGGTGVLVFFVLSGFLITWLLLKEEEQFGKLSLRLFYMRRTLRIMPAFYVYWFLIVGSLIAFSKHLHIAQAVSSFFYVNNYYQAVFGDPNTGLSHTWSLGVEEQFYLVWPFVVFALSRTSIRRVLIGIIVVTLFAKATLAFCLQWQGMPDFGTGVIYYFATPLRLDAFGIGAAIAVFDLTKWTVRPRWVLLAWACALLLGLMNASLGHHPDLPWSREGVVGRFWGGLSLGYPLFLLQNRQFIWGYAVIDLVAGLLIISATQANKLQQLCANRPLVYLGRISYGLYIWHWPILVLIMPVLPNPWSFAGVICFGLFCAAAVGVAHLSYFGFERRFLLLKTVFSQRKDSAISSGHNRDQVIEGEVPGTARERQD